MHRNARGSPPRRHSFRSPVSRRPTSGFLLPPVLRSAARGTGSAGRRQPGPAPTRAHFVLFTILSLGSVQPCCANQHGDGDPNIPTATDAHQIIAVEKQWSSNHMVQCECCSTYPCPASSNHRHCKVLGLITDEDRAKLHARCNWQSVVHFEGAWLHSNSGQQHLQFASGLRSSIRLLMALTQADHVCAQGPTCPMAFCRKNSRLCHANASSLVLPSRRPYADEW